MPGPLAKMTRRKNDRRGIRRTVYDEGKTVSTPEQVGLHQELISSLQQETAQRIQV